MHANKPPKIFMLLPKKIHTRNLITKKIPAARKIGYVKSGFQVLYAVEQFSSLLSR